MRTGWLVLGAFAGFMVLGGVSGQGSQSGEGASPLATPVFHHVHQNSTDPAKAIAGLQTIFPTLTKTTVGGFEGLQNGTTMSILFTKVSAAPPVEPQSAFLRHVYSVPNVRDLLQYLRTKQVEIRPLFTVEGPTVDVSTDTYQNGMTMTGFQEAKQKGTLQAPTKSGGYIIYWGPEHVLMETTERATLKEAQYVLVDMWQNQPLCAQLWYQKHLNVPARAGRGGAPAPVYTEATCNVPKSEYSFPSVEKVGTKRVPGGGADFGTVALNWFPAQADAPLAPTRGQLMDHFAVSVPNLDPWIAKLRAENVTFLQQPYKFGDGRAVMIEGPSRESIEIVEKK